MVMVTGPLGIGKSAFAIASLHHPQIAAKFGTRRLYVDLYGGETAQDIHSRIRNKLSIEAEASASAIDEELKKAPLFVVFDHLEKTTAHSRVWVDLFKGISRSWDDARLLLQLQATGANRGFCTKFAAISLVGSL